MRANPFGDLDELFERMGSELPVGFGGPRVDIIDEGETYLLRADVPGYERDDLDVSLHDRRLTISATPEDDGDEDSDRYVRRERDQHGTTRTIKLPEPVDPDGVTASYDRGVLEVRLPKREPEEGHTIDVE